MRAARKGYLLEELTLGTLRDRKRRYSAFLKYQWDFFAELAGQRNQIREALFETLIGGSLSDFKFERWQRALKYKYSLHPLSTVGSVAWIGGRFNIGRDLNPEMAHFPALYVASNKDTALQEAIGPTPGEPGQELTLRELALMNPQSETIVSMSGMLEKGR